MVETNSTQFRVMIIEDSKVMRSMITSIVQSDKKFKVVAAAVNGKDALELLTSCKPDLILLDIEMPEMDGLEFMRHACLRTAAQVIILSSVAGAGSEKAARARALGAAAIIGKPSGALSLDLKQKKGAEVISLMNRLLSEQD